MAFVTNIRYGVTTNYQVDNSQVVKFAVYMYFTIAVIAEQELTNHPMLVIPIILILKLIFFFGWLEVAKAIDDPWDGKDCEDFKVIISE